MGPVSGTEYRTAVRVASLEYSWRVTVFDLVIWNKTQSYCTYYVYVE